MILFSENKTDLQGKVPMLSQVYCNSSVINPGSSCGVAGCPLQFTATRLPLRVPKDYVKVPAGNILCLFTSIFTLCKFFIWEGGGALPWFGQYKFCNVTQHLWLSKFFYSPTNVQVIVLKTILKFTLNQLRHVSVQAHRLQGAHYLYLLKLHFVKSQLWYIGVWLKSVVMWLHILVVSLLMCVCVAQYECKNHLWLRLGVQHTMGILHILTMDSTVSDKNHVSQWSVSAIELHHTIIS